MLRRVRLKRAVEIWERSEGYAAGNYASITCPSLMLALYDAKSAPTDRVASYHRGRLAIGYIYSALNQDMCHRVLQPRANEVSNTWFESEFDFILLIPCEQVKDDFLTRYHGRSQYTPSPGTFSSDKIRNFWHSKNQDVLWKWRDISAKNKKHRTRRRNS